MSSFAWPRISFLIHFFFLSYTAVLPGTEYVGRDACVECHAEQVKLWQGSHHDLAMQHVSDVTALADFNNTEFAYTGITSRFYKKNDKFMVRTDGPDGKSRDYEIKYVFGITPLQQYLVELDKGHLQAQTIAWDSRVKKEGGQRWFHLMLALPAATATSRIVCN